MLYRTCNFVKTTLVYELDACITGGGRHFNQSYNGLKKCKYIFKITQQYLV